MKYRYWMMLFSILLASCNLVIQGSDTPSPSTPQPDSSPTASSSPTIIPIETLLARDTPTPVPTATPTILLASPKNQPVNCRYGPGISYAVVGGLQTSRQAEVIGKNIDETWWYVLNPSDPSTNCWLAADFVIVSGNVDSLPVVNPPEIGVTDIEVQVDPVLMNVGCTAFPQTVNVKAQITTNGPSLVTWRWEVSNGDIQADRTLLFESEGKREVTGFVTVWSANDYRVDLHVILPNDKTGSAIFKVTCVP